MPFSPERGRLREARKQIEREMNDARHQARLAEITIEELTPFIASCCRSRPSDPFWADKTDEAVANMFLAAMRTATKWHAVCANYDILWDRTSTALFRLPWDSELPGGIQPVEWLASAKFYSRGND